MQTEMDRRAEQMRAEEFCYSAMELENTAKMEAVRADFDRLERAVEGKEETVGRLDRRIRDLASETDRLREEKNVLNSEYSEIREIVRSEGEKSVIEKRENSRQVDRFQSVFLALMQKLVYVRDASLSLDAQGDEKVEILNRLDCTLFDLQVIHVMLHSTALHYFHEKVHGCGAEQCVRQALALLRSESAAAPSHNTLRSLLYPLLVFIPLNRTLCLSLSLHGRLL